MVHGGMLDGGRAKWNGGGEQGNVTGVRDAGLCACALFRQAETTKPPFVYIVFIEMYFRPAGTANLSAFP